jgi:DNA-binding transcriptional ArsR family regulator
MEIFEALADPTRRHIVELLSRRERAAGEIAAEFQVSRPAISKHLRVLRDAGIVDVREVAQRRIYRLDPKSLESAERWLARHRRFWEQRLDALERHVQERSER